MPCHGVKVRRWRRVRVASRHLGLSGAAAALAARALAVATYNLHTHALARQLEKLDSFSLGGQSGQGGAAERPRSSSEAEAAVAEATRGLKRAAAQLQAVSP